MTLHTRVMVTSPTVAPAAVFVKMRQIIGAGEQYDAWTSPDPESDNEYRRTMTPGFHMDLGQGLPALMWAHGDGWGTLGDPEVGALGSTIQRITRDPKRDFGAMALGAVAASLTIEGTS